MYATLADAKSYLTIPTDTIDDDEIITKFILASQAYIDSYTGRTFEADADTTRTYDAVRDVDGSGVFFYDADICKIVSITNGDGVAVTSDQYVTEPSDAPFYAIKLLGSSGLHWTYTDDPENAISIVGKWAFSEVANSEIEQACLRLTAWFYRQKDTNADIDRPLLTGDGVVLMPSAMPSDIAAILHPYRRLT